MKIYKRRFSQFAGIFLVLIMVFSTTLPANADSDMPEDEGSDLMYEEIDTESEEGAMPLGDLIDTREAKTISTNGTYTSSIFKVSNKFKGNKLNIWFQNTGKQGVTVVLLKKTGLSSYEEEIRFSVDTGSQKAYTYSKSDMYGKKYIIKVHSKSGSLVLGWLKVGNVLNYKKSTLTHRFLMLNMIAIKFII